jgi:hypothetical protein
MNESEVGLTRLVLLFSPWFAAKMYAHFTSYEKDKDL